MSASASVTSLRVANEAFLVASMIERCPKTMMLRELVVNAIEASQSAPDATVEIRARTIAGVRKLSIWNSGRGLSATELFAICDLASSLNKQNSLDGNFGMGAKVASLPSNRHGLRYRSCKDGTVSEVLLGERNGVYGRLLTNGKEVRDATLQSRAEGEPLDQDWTEVVLFGNRPEQDTVADPYDGNPKLERDWLARSLLLRFWQVPAAVTVRLAPEVFGTGAPCALQCFANRRDRFGRTETVRTASGIAIHYFYDPPEGDATHSARGALAATGSLACLIYKQEMYDIRDDSRWLQEAPIFGFPFGARYISVFVELPDDYPVRPEAYRQFLRFRGGDQRQVFLQELGQLVRAHIPEWLSEVARSYGPKTSRLDEDVQNELRALLVELDVGPQYMPPVAVNRSLVLAGTEASPRPAAASTPPQKRYEKPPHIIYLDTDELLEERGLQGRAARFYPQSHQLFVNLKYASVTEMTKQLAAEFAGRGQAELVFETAQNLAQRMVIRRVARSLIFTLTKKAEGWTVTQVQSAQSPESLSLVADDWAAFLESARSAMEKTLLLADPSAKAA